MWVCVMDDSNGMTLGEVGRTVERIAKEVGELTRVVNEHAVADAVRGEKIARLERIVYGALGTALAALLTAIIAAVTTTAGTR